MQVPTSKQAKMRTADNTRKYWLSDTSETKMVEIKVVGITQRNKMSLNLLKYDQNWQSYDEKTECYPGLTAAPPSGHSRKMKNTFLDISLRHQLYQFQKGSSKTVACRWHFVRCKYRKQAKMRTADKQAAILKNGRVWHENSKCKRYGEDQEEQNEPMFEKIRLKLTKLWRK